MTDQFDEQPALERVGAHRKRVRKTWRWWMTALVALASIVVLTGVGLLLVQSLRGGLIDSATVETPEPALTDPAQLPEGVTVSVLGAAEAGDAAANVLQRLSEKGWPTLADGITERELETSTVYCSDASLSTACRGVGQELGIEPVVVIDTEISGSQITVVLGADADALGLR